MPETTAPALHPEKEPIWSKVYNETLADGQTLTLYGHFGDGARDWESGVLAPFGDWVAPEDEAALEETLKRTLRRRHAQRLAEADSAKPAAAAPGADKKEEKL